MSGLRLYVHDRHGHHVNGDERVQRARTPHRCDMCRGGIRLGAWYGIATLYPSSSDFTWVDRLTLAPSKSAQRVRVCLGCMTDEKRDLIAAHEMEGVR